MCDWHVDPNVFIIRLMRQVLERRNIKWVPYRTIYFDPQPYRSEDGYIERNVIQVCIALEKLSRYEYQSDAEEFEHMYTTLGPSDEDFVDFFANCVSTCFLTRYTPFNFLRYLRYIIDFTVFCYNRGFPSTINQAVIAISSVVHENEQEFKYLQNWIRLISESDRIIYSDLRRLYYYNYYSYRV